MYAYLDKSQEAPATNSISEAGPIPDGSMARLNPVSEGKEKASGLGWTSSLILAGGCLPCSPLLRAVVNYLRAVGKKTFSLCERRACLLYTSDAADE